MNKELDLEIYDIVKITNGVGSIWVESIREMDKENYYTESFKIDKQCNVESLYIDDTYQLEMVWRLDKNRNYTMIYPVQRLETIDNSNPSEALEETLRDIAYDLENDDNPFLRDRYYGLLDVKQALLKAQEQEKVLEIIFKKTVGIFQLSCCKNVYEYNDLKFNDYEKLTQEEFELLKRY